MTNLDISPLTLFGRTFQKDGALGLFWTNTGFAFCFRGTAATATFVSDNTQSGACAYLCVYLDGGREPYKTLCLTERESRVALADNLPAGAHTVELRKRSEAANGGSATVFLTDLCVEGEFLAPPKKHLRTMEFVGDSITCGYGNLGSPASSVFVTDEEDGTLAYAALTARALDADYTLVARSGIGFCTGYAYHGNPDLTDCSIYPYYTKVAALPGNTQDGSEWDFAAAPKDLVVISLGTNDNGCTASAEQIKEHAGSLLRLVREKNPHSVILWVFGMMGEGRVAAPLSQAIAELGDKHAHLLLLPALNRETEGVGTNGHPSLITHRERSERLVRYIRELMGWT